MLSDVAVGATTYVHFAGCEVLGPAGPVPGSSTVREVSLAGFDWVVLRPVCGVEELGPSALVAAWLTVNACPATVTVPVRGDDPVFVSTEYETVPAPLPEVPALMLIHDELVTAIQVQLVEAVTATVPAPPSEGAD